MTTFFKGQGKFLLIPVFLLFALFIVFQSFGIDFSGMSVNEVKNEIQQYGFWAPVVFIVLYQFRPLILLPATLTDAAVGVLWGWKGLLYIVIAYTICATWQFFLARYCTKNMAKKIVGGKLKNIHDMIKNNAFTTIFIVRLVPNIAFDIQNLAFGLTRVKFSVYILATFLGLLPGKIALVYFGNSFVEAMSKPENWWKIIPAILLLIGIFFIQQCFVKNKKGKTQ